MATFGGETVVNIERVSSSTNSNQTLYTVPAGRYARVDVLQAIFASGTSNGDLVIGDIVVFSKTDTAEQSVGCVNDSGSDNSFIRQVFLDETDTVRTVNVASNVDVEIVIFEYNKP